MTSFYKTKVRTATFHFHTDSFGYLYVAGIKVFLLNYGRNCTLSVHCKQLFFRKFIHCCNKLLLKNAAITFLTILISHTNSRCLLSLGKINNAAARFRPARKLTKCVKHDLDFLQTPED
jgi:hypothetical protein